MVPSTLLLWVLCKSRVYDYDVTFHYFSQFLAFLRDLPFSHHHRFCCSLFTVLSLSHHSFLGPNANAWTKFLSEISASAIQICYLNPFSSNKLHWFAIHLRTC